MHGSYILPVFEWIARASPNLLQLIVPLCSSKNMNAAGAAGRYLPLCTDSIAAEAWKSTGDSAAAYQLPPVAINHVLVLLFYLLSFGNVIPSVHASF